MGRYVMMFVLTILLVPGTVSANPERTFLLPGDVEIEMVWIEPGTFMMGSSQEEVDSLHAVVYAPLEVWPYSVFLDDVPQEGPQHEVTITRGFWLGKYELTQGQWESIMGTTPWLKNSGYAVPRPCMQLDSGEGVAPDNPAQYISWDAVQDLIERLNQAEGDAVYRLPTEAEWEYACRAGTDTWWSFGNDESQLGLYAWYDESQSGGVGPYVWNYAHRVGTKLPNPWGLYDMHGNVHEWVQDWYGHDSYTSSSQVDPTGPSTGSRRVSRGGDFGSEALLVRSATRSPWCICGVGVRLLRQGPPPEPSVVSPASWGEIKSRFR